MKKEERLNLIKNNLKESKNVLCALGDENRQNIILVLLENCNNGGIRVKDIAVKVNLSRPAVSHHLKILLDNNLVSIEQKGTKNYYHITGAQNLLIIKSLFNNIEKYIEERISE